MSEPRDIRIKRLAMRSMRRGIREMDVILQAYADRRLAGMADGAMDIYEAFLAENDQDLYQWVSGQRAGPVAYDALIADIRAGLAPPARG